MRMHLCGPPLSVSQSVIQSRLGHSCASASPPSWLGLFNEVLTTAPLFDFIVELRHCLSSFLLGPKFKMRFSKVWCETIFHLAAFIYSGPGFANGQYFILNIHQHASMEHSTKLILKLIQVQVLCHKPITSCYGFIVGFKLGWTGWDYLAHLSQTDGQTIS